MTSNRNHHLPGTAAGWDEESESYDRDGAREARGRALHFERKTRDQEEGVIHLK